MRVAVVTGVARKAGIGHACAIILHRSSYRVIGLDKAPAEDGTLWTEGCPHAILLRLDLSDEAAIGGLPARLALEASVSAVHCLVNNAGIAGPYLPTSGPGPAERRAAFRQYIQVNLTAAFLLTEALVPLMPRGDASVVHISSTRAHQSEPNSEAYAAAKAGLIGLTHAQAATLAGTARVNCISPGWIDSSGHPESLRPEDHAWHWTGSVGRPNDVAEMVAFLASPERSGFITAQEFVVDGGVSRRMNYPE